MKLVAVGSGLVLVSVLGACPGGRPLPHEDAPRVTYDWYWPLESGPAVEGARRDGPRPDTRKPDKQPLPPDQLVCVPQGKTCSGNDATFTANVPPCPGKSISLQIDGGNQDWNTLTVGVSAPSAAAVYVAGAINVSCEGYGPCHWTFPNVPVPSVPGKYTFHLKLGANEQAFCTP